MASKKASKGELAARYAAALYELASENKAVDQVADDLAKLKILLAESRDLSRLLRSVAIPRADQFRALRAVMGEAGMSELTQRFLGVITENRRLFALPDIIEAFRNLMAERRGEVRVDVRVARPLTDGQKDNLDNTLRAILDAKVDAAVTVDPALLGGMIVRVGSRMIDSTLKSKIDRMQIAMKSPGGAV